MAYVTSPDGVAGTVPDSDLERAVREFGYKVREPSAREIAREQAADAPLRASVEGLAQGVLPFGAGATVTKLIDTKIMGLSPEQSLEGMQLREEENPLLHGGAKVLGFMAGPGKVVGAATKGIRLAGGLLGRAAAGGVEGSVVGLSEGVNEAVIKDRPLVAEQLAVRMVTGALAGAGATAGAEVFVRGGAAGFSTAAGAAKKLTGAVESLTPKGFVGGLVGDVAEGIAGPILGPAKAVLRVGRKLAGQEGAAAGFKNMVEKRLAAGADFLGPFRPAIEQAYSQGPEHLLQTHQNLMNSPRAEEYQARMAIEPESPEVTHATVQRLDTLTAVQQAAEAQAQRTTAAVDGLFARGPGKQASLTTPLTKKAFDNKMADIDSMLRDPESVYARVPDVIAATAPETIGTAVATMIRGAQYLKDKAPRSPYEGLPESVSPKWEPSAADLDRFNRAREAVEDPAKVLKNMAQGYLSPDQMDAIKSVYPAMYEDLRLQITERLLSATKPLTYQQKLAVMSVVGTKALGMSAQQAQILQASFGAGAQQSNDGMKKPDGRQQVDQEKNLQTQSQKLQGR